MNIFECGAIVCTPIGIASGIYFGSDFGILGGCIGALAGGVAGFFAGPLLGLGVLVLAHIECVISGDVPLFGKGSDEGPDPIEDDEHAAPD